MALNPFLCLRPLISLGPVGGSANSLLDLDCRLPPQNLICLLHVRYSADNVLIFFPYSFCVSKLGFRNEIFATLEKVVDRLCATICRLSSILIRSITGRNWIIAIFNLRTVSDPPCISSVHSAKAAAVGIPYHPVCFYPTLSSTAAQPGPGIRWFG